MRAGVSPGVQQELSLANLSLVGDSNRVRRAEARTVGGP